MALTKAQFDTVIKKLKKDGQLTASGILTMAKSSKSPLHSLFEWDNTKAARQYRLEQARKIIKRANVTIENQEDKIIHVPVSSSKGEGTYKEAKTIVNSISDFELAMSEALKKLSSAEKAVELLKTVSSSENVDENVAILSVALQGLQTASEAIHKLH